MHLTTTNERISKTFFLFEYKVSFYILNSELKLNWKCETEVRDTYEEDGEKKTIITCVCVCDSTTETVNKKNNRFLVN